MSRQPAHPIIFATLIVIGGLAIFLGYLNAGLALLVGLVIALVLRHSFTGYCRKYSAMALKTAIVGMGFGLNIQQVIATTQQTFLVTFLTIAIAIIAGILLVKLLRVHKETGILVTSGTAICGGSAIAAVSQVIKSRSDHTAMAVTVVFLLNIVALYAFPILGEFFELTQHQFGIWAALAIHDTSSVLGAAAQFGQEALEIATTTKLFRALWIIPLTLLVGYWNKQPGAKPHIPIFIVLFVVASLVNSYLPLGVIADYTAHFSKKLMIFALFLLGLGITPDIVKNLDPKPLLLGTLLWITIAAVSLVLVLYH
ncbi:YeiH family protein [Pleionea sediminis]|uniref:YeiH family protein n=1 Tax=Pleionea sediminis TaxID=2569479 RepID=UPI0013DDA9F7|nr:putative sulfate exporter family transporter [Pleionea sediminis]